MKQATLENLIVGLLCVVSWVGMVVAGLYGNGFLK